MDFIHEHKDVLLKLLTAREINSLIDFDSLKWVRKDPKYDIKVTDDYVATISKLVETARIDLYRLDEETLRGIVKVIKSECKSSDDC